MKKLSILLVFILAATVAVAQEQTNNTDNETSIGSHNIGLVGKLGVFTGGGVEYESPGTVKANNTTVKTLYARALYTGMDYTFDGRDESASGFQVELGSRSYFFGEANTEGFFLGSAFVYGQNKIEESYITEEGLQTYEGTYKYISILSPEIGYRFKFGNFSFAPFAGTMWKIEIKPDGDIDNKNFDNWSFKSGITLMYHF